jgi:zinc finger SWIM domain-containing protein 3
VPANSVQLLLLEIQKEREKDPGLFVDVGLKPNNEMEYLLFQTSSMRSTLHKFPEHMILDATYCVNDISYPLVTFMCVDGNNESRVAGFALVPSESMAVYEKILTVFKNANPDLPIETFMIDKCMAEMGAIERIFPAAKIELCLYHVLDAFKKKLGTFRLKTEEAEPIQEILTYMALGCKSEEDYAEQLQELGNVCPPEFYVYFLRHWDSRRHRWLPYHRKENGRKPRGKPTQ